MEPCSTSQGPVEMNKEKGFQARPGPAEPGSPRMEPESLDLKSKISPELGNSAIFEKHAYSEHPLMQRVEKAPESPWPPTMDPKHPLGRRQMRMSLAWRRG